VNGQISWLYSKIPPDVMFDDRLNRTDLRVYSCIAGVVWQGTVASIGIRLIAKQIKRSVALVAKSLDRLERAGHIKRQPVNNGKRSKIDLTPYDVFGTKQRDGITEIVSCPRGDRRMVSVGKERLRA
jgi:hypothetical protein